MFRDLLRAKAWITNELAEYFLLPSGAGGARRLLRGRFLMAVLPAIALVLGVAGYLATRPVNLARSRPATSSSRGFGTTPEGVVDGLKPGQLGFHSQEEAHPSLTIDLGAPHDVGRVVVFGRTDCCFDQSVPLALELSLDGSTFRRVEVRSKAFSQFDPWEVRLTPPGSARYVRLVRNRRGLLVVSEVEVYER